jgi:hypothetical protein
LKNIITILAVACIIAGCIIGCNSSLAIADYGAIALEAFGFTVLVIKTVKKAEKKTWKEYTGIILFIVAGVCCGVAGIAEATMTTIITTVAGMVALIIGLVVVKKKNA